MERAQLIPPEHQSFNSLTSLRLRFFSKFLIYFLKWKKKTGQWPRAFEWPLLAMVMLLVNTKSTCKNSGRVSHLSLCDKGHFKMRWRSDWLWKGCCSAQEVPLTGKEGIQTMGTVHANRTQQTTWARALANVVTWHGGSIKTHALSASLGCRKLSPVFSLSLYLLNPCFSHFLSRRGPSLSSITSPDCQHLAWCWPQLRRSHTYCFPSR